MVVEKLSDIGGIVCVDGRANELIMNAIGDGNVKPGWGLQLVEIGAGVATACEVLKYDYADNDDRFMGILLPTYDQDCDTACTDRQMVEYVIPSSGHKYNIAIADVGSGALAGTVGTPVNMGAVDGEFVVATADIEAQTYFATVSKEIVESDRYAEVIWRA